MMAQCVTCSGLILKVSCPLCVCVCVCVCLCAVFVSSCRFILMCVQAVCLVDLFTMGVVLFILVLLHISQSGKI